MGLLKRIYNRENSAQNNNKYSDILNNLNASRNLFKTDFILQDKTSNEYLALNNQAAFIYKYLNLNTIDNAIKKNPVIVRLVQDNDLSMQYDLNNVSSIIVSHLIPTARLVQKIYLKINNTQFSDDYICLIQAALLHDIGKIFIPKSILNKNSKLSSYERQIIELHNRFSFEILETTDLKPQVARLAWEHHNYDNCFKRTPENQALTVADIYCALREVRPYKKALNDITAKTILYDMGASGKFDVSYIRHLFA